MVSANVVNMQNSLEDELEFDMWDGQFEFLGNSFVVDGVTEAATNGHPVQTPIKGYDPTADLVLAPISIEEAVGNIKARWAAKHSKMNLKKNLLVDDVSENVQMLQQQMNVLADNQSQSDERYTRAKQENAALQARILILEEQLRENELRSEEKYAEEVKRHRELVARVDREKQLQVENCAIRLQTLEQSNANLKEETLRYKNEVEAQRKEKERLKETLEENQHLVASLKEEIQMLRENEKKIKEQKNAAEHLLEEVSKEMEMLRADKIRALTALQNCKDVPSQVETELQIQLDSLKQEHRSLQESYEELQALLLTRSIQEGRSLLTGSNNLAAELEEMTQDDHEVLRYENHSKMKTALKEQQEVNAQLRAYIDNILLNIVENYPQLLEVKSSSS